MSLMQVSIYAKNVFVGTLTRNAAGAFVSGVDPWVREDLFNYSGARRKARTNGNIACSTQSIRRPRATMFRPA